MADLAVKLGNTISDSLTKSLAGISAGIKGSMSSAVGFMPMISAFEKGFSAVEKQVKVSNENDRNREIVAQREQGFTEESTNEQRRYDETLLGFTKGMAQNIELIQKDVAKILELMSDKFDWSKLLAPLALLKGLVPKGLGDALAKIGEFFKKIPDFFKKIPDFLKSIPGKIGTLFDDIIKFFQKFKFPRLGALLGAWIDNLKKLFKIDELAKLLKFDKISKMISRLFMALSNSIQLMKLRFIYHFEKLREFIDAVFGKVKIGARKMIDGMTNSIRGLFSRIESSFRSSKLGNFTSDVVKTIRNVIGSIASPFIKLGKAIVDDLTDIARSFRRVIAPAAIVAAGGAAAGTSAVDDAAETASRAAAAADAARNAQQAETAVRISEDAVRVARTTANTSMENLTRISTEQRRVAEMAADYLRAADAAEADLWRALAEGVDHVTLDRMIANQESLYRASQDMMRQSETMIRQTEIARSAAVADASRVAELTRETQRLTEFAQEARRISEASSEAIRSATAATESIRDVARVVDGGEAIRSAGLLGGMMTTISKFFSGFGSMFTGPLKIFGELTDVTAFLKGIGKVLGPIGVLFSIFDGISNAVDTKKLEALFGEGKVGIQERISAFIGGFIGGFGGLFDFFANMMGFEGTDFQKSWTENITVSFNKVLDVIKGIFTFVGDIIRSPAFQSVWESFKGATGTIFDGFSQLFNFIKEIFTSETAKNIFSTLGSFLAESAKTFFSTIKTIVDLVVGIFTLKFDKVKEAGVDLMSTVWNGVKNLAQILVDGLGPVFKSAINSLIDGMADLLPSWMGDKIRTLKMGAAGEVATEQDIINKAEQDLSQIASENTEYQKTVTRIQELENISKSRGGSSKNLKLTKNEIEEFNKLKSRERILATSATVAERDMQELRQTISDAVARRDAAQLRLESETQKDSALQPRNVEALTAAVMQVESGGNKFAVSPKGAVGTMQTMPQTLIDPGYGVQPAKDNSLEEAERVGKDYLKAMLREYNGNETYALAAYNWGPGNVNKWIEQGADISKLPTETQNYLVKVQSLKGKTATKAPSENQSAAETARLARSGAPSTQATPAATSGSASTSTAAGKKTIFDLMDQQMVAKYLGGDDTSITVEQVLDRLDDDLQALGDSLVVAQINGVDEQGRNVEQLEITIEKTTNFQTEIQRQQFEKLEAAQRAQTEAYLKTEKEKADRLKGYEDERKRLQQQFDSQLQGIFRPMVDALSGPAGTYGPEASVNAGTALAKTLSKDFERVGVSVFGKAYGAAIGNTFQQLAGVYMNEFITETLAPSLGMDAKYLNRSINTYMRGIEVVKPQLEQVNKSLNESTKRLEEFEKKKGKVTDAEIVLAAGKGGFTSEQLSRISEYNVLKKDVEEKKKQKALIKEQERQYKQAALGDLIYGMTGIATTPRNMIDAYQGGAEGLTKDLASFFGAPFDPLFNPKKAQYAVSAKDAVRMQELEKRIAADKANQAAIDQANKTNQEAMARVNQEHVQGQSTVSKDHIQAQQSTNTSFLGGLTDVFNAAVAGISSAVSGIGSTISSAVDSAKTTLGFGKKDITIPDWDILPKPEVIIPDWDILPPAAPKVESYDIYEGMTGAVSYGVTDADKTYPSAGGEWDVLPPIPVKSRYDGVLPPLPSISGSEWDVASPQVLKDAVAQGVTEAIKITPKTTILPGGGTQIRTPEGKVVTQSVTGGRVSVSDGRVSLTRQTAADQARNERLLGVGSNLAGTAIVNALTGGRASKSPIGGMASNVAGDFIKSLVSGKGFNLSGSIGKQFGLGDITSWGQLFSSSASALPTKIGGMFSNAAMSSWMPNFARQGVMDFGSGFAAAGQGWEGISGAFQSGNMSHMLGTGAGILGNALQGYQYGQMAKNLIGGDYSMGKGMTTVGKVGTAVASAIWGPVGGAIAGAVDGLLSRAFGRKPKEITATGFRGTISGTGDNSLEKYEDWFQKGGWFRSDKSGTNVSAMDPELAKAFSDTTKGIGESNKKLLENLGLSTSFGNQDITRFRKDVKIEFTGKETEEERMQIVQNSFEDFSNSMIKQVLPFMDQFTKEGESAAEALQRLGNAFNAAVPGIQALGFIEPRTFFGIPPAIIGASEDYLKLYTANLTEKLATAFGGADQMNAAFNQFAELAYTQEERQQISLDIERAKLQDAKKSLEEVGISLNENQFTTEEERRNEAKRLMAIIRERMIKGEISNEQFADSLTALNQFLVTGKLADQIAGVTEDKPKKPLVFTERTRGIGPAAPGELEFGANLSNVSPSTDILGDNILTLGGAIADSSLYFTSSLISTADIFGKGMISATDLLKSGLISTTELIASGLAASANTMYSGADLLNSGLLTSSKAVETAMYSGSDLIKAGLVSSSDLISSGLATSAETVGTQYYSGAELLKAGLVSSSDLIGSSLTSSAQLAQTGLVESANTMYSGADLLNSGLVSSSDLINSGLATSAETVGTQYYSGANLLGAGLVSSSDLISSGLATSANTMYNGSSLVATNLISATDLVNSGLATSTNTIYASSDLIAAGLTSSSELVANGLMTSATNLTNGLLGVNTVTANSVEVTRIASENVVTSMTAASGVLSTSITGIQNQINTELNRLVATAESASADLGDAATSASGTVGTAVSEAAISIGLGMMAVSDQLGILGGLTGLAVGAIGTAVVDAQMDAISAQMSAIDAAASAAAAISAAVSVGADGSVSVTAAETSVGISVASMDAALGAASADAGGQSAADSAAAAAAGVGISDGGGIAGMEGISDAGGGGGGDGGGGWASGGKFAGNHPMLVGEAGPEIVVPNQGGTVIPTHKIFEALKNSAPYDSMARNAIESFVSSASPTPTVVQNIQATPGSITPAYMAQQEMNRMLQAERDIVTSINSSMVNQTINNVSSPTTSIVSNGSGGGVRSDNPITNAFTRSVARPRMY